MPLGIEVGLSPGDFVLDGDPAPSPKRGRSQLPSPKRYSSPIFGPCMLRSNGCMDQDATWYRDRPRPRRHYVRWEPSFPSPKTGRSHRPQFLADFYCGQTAGCIKMTLGMEVGLGPGYIVLDGDSASLPQKEDTAPNFRPIFIVAKRLDASRCYLVWR